MQAGYFVGQKMQNNCVCHAMISKMLLLQYDVHNYYIYNQCWADQTQEVCTLSLYLPISIECVTLVEN